MVEERRVRRERVLQERRRRLSSLLLALRASGLGTAKALAVVAFVLTRLATVSRMCNPTALVLERWEREREKKARGEGSHPSLYCHDDPDLLGPPLVGSGTTADGAEDDEASRMAMTDRALLPLYRLLSHIPPWFRTGLPASQGEATSVDAAEHAQRLLSEQAEADERKGKIKIKIKSKIKSERKSESKQRPRKKEGGGDHDDEEEEYDDDDDEEEEEEGEAVTLFSASLSTLSSLLSADGLRSPPSPPWHSPSFLPREEVRWIVDK